MVNSSFFLLCHSAVFRLISWQERQFCKRTFEEDVICDVEEIRQLIDEDIQALDEQEKGESK